MAIEELGDFIYGNYDKRIGFPKENSYYSMKHHKKNCYCLQLNFKKCLILVIPKNTISLI